MCPNKDSMTSQDILGLPPLSESDQALIKAIESGGTTAFLSRAQLKKLYGVMTLGWIMNLPRRP